MSNIDDTDSNEDNFQSNNVLSGTFNYYLKFIIINQTEKINVYSKAFINSIVHNKNVCVSPSPFY